MVECGQREKQSGRTCQQTDRHEMVHWCDDCFFRKLHKVMHKDWVVLRWLNRTEREAFAPSILYAVTHKDTAVISEAWWLGHHFSWYPKGTGITMLTRDVEKLLALLKASDA